MRSFDATLAMSMAEAQAAVTAALAEQGFGVLTEIDVAATLLAKLGVERTPLKILGACNPTFANRSLEIDPSVALVLPCNVVLEATAEGTHVAIVDPRALMDDERFTELAEDAAGRLRAALHAVENAAVA
jgi:uncharacterized protein (DUF302 family)